MTLVYLVVAWVAGVLVASRAAGSVSLWLAIAGASALAGVLLRASRRDRRALACLCLFALGAARLDLAQRPLAADHIARRIGDGRLVISGLVDSLPDPRATYVNLRVSVDSARQGATAEPASGRVLVQAPLSGRYRYGDRVQITGALTLPPAYDDFSYRDYLARRGIHALLRAESVEVVGRGGRPWLRAIYALRERSAAIIEEVLPSPQAPVLAGILLGDESGIPKDVREAFNRTGASHVIAISGANIAVLLRALMGLLTPLAGKDRAALLASVGVAVYAVLVGGDPGVLRAVFMGVLALVASRTGRRAHGLTSLAFAVWVLSAYDPEVLWDIGFQLSVAATLGLVLFTDDLTALFGRVLGRVFPAATAQRLLGWLSEPLVVSVAAQIATTPLIVYAFGRLSIASLLTNLLIVPVQPYIMIAGWLALVAGHASIALGEVLAWGVWLPLTYMLRVIETLARFSWSSAEVRLSAGAVWLIYVGLLLWGVSRTMHPGDRAALWAKVRAAIPAYAAGGAGLIVALLVWQAALRQPDGRLHVWFLDVGDGSAALIETPRGAQVLIGSGKSPVRLQAALGRVMPFQDRSLDAVILTRDDDDENAALAALFDRYSTRALLFAAPAGTRDDLAGLLDRAAAALVRLQPGHVLATDDGVRIEALMPGAAKAAAVRVTYGEASFLFWADFGAPEEIALLETGYYPRSTVFQLSGSGSDRANTARFLAAVSPEIGVVAVDTGSPTGLPHPTVIERLGQIGTQRVYRTDRDGTVEMISDGVTLEVRAGR